jgi:choline kinase
MAGYKVLVTTSGIGSRLGELTNYTNKCLIRVSDKPAISYIIESYPEDTEFVVSLGYYGSHVRQFCELAYPNKSITFIEIDKYEGEGSSLGYSILQCKQELQCPFIFHASDTILEGTRTMIPEFNYVIGARKKESSEYRMLRLNSEHKLAKIHEQGELDFELSYVGAAGIKDFELFFLNLEKLINNNHHDTADVHVINEMLPEVDFTCIETEGWHDTGNTTELYRARKKFESTIKVLDKKGESTFLFDDFVIKFFSDAEINQNRVDRVKELEGLAPEIISSTENFYKYKKAEGQLFSKSVNEKSFQRFLQWAKDNLWEPREVDEFYSECIDFYVNKTEKRISDFLGGVDDVQQEINGELIPPVNELLSKVDTEWLCTGVPVRFHGDFILDNIIETQDGFCLIDWRQDFGGNLSAGDIYYDLAKLNHNLMVNHSIVDRKLFDQSSKNCHILCSSTLIRCRELLHKFIVDNGYDLRKVEVLSSIIWLNMSPLHDHPFDNFLFTFGKFKLYKAIHAP